MEQATAAQVHAVERPRRAREIKKEIEYVMFASVGIVAVPCCDQDRGLLSRSRVPTRVIFATPFGRGGTCPKGGDKDSAGGYWLA